MTDQTNDPVAAAAAQLEQQAAQPSSTEPSAPVVAQPDPTPAVVSAATASLPTSTEPSIGDDPNAIASPVAAKPDTPASAAPASTPAGIVGIEGNSAAEPAPAVSQSMSNTIRAHIANLKQHLRLRGFEEEVVTAFHKELDAIEKWL